MTELQVIRKLSASDDVLAFDCGQAALNTFLQRYALGNQRAHSAQTYVCCTHQGAVAGFYSLTVGSVSYAGAPQRIRQGLAHHPIPVMLLARLAVDQTWQQRGLGQALLKDALLRTLQAADIAGLRAVLVHAKDEAAKNWYRRFDFQSGATDPFHLYLLLKDLKALLA